MSDCQKIGYRPRVASRTLERGILAVEGNQHTALSPASGRWVVHVGPTGEIILLRAKQVVWLLGSAFRVVAASGTNWCSYRGPGARL